MAVDPARVPTIGPKALHHVLAEGQAGRSVDADPVVVPEHDQLAKAEMTGQRAGLMGDPFHEVSIAGDDVGVVVHDGKAGPVEARRQPALRDRHADRVG
jgi:hypothetical protein